MVTAILSLLASLAGFGIWLARREIKAANSPERIKRNELSRADAAIAAGPQGVRDINVQIEEGLNNQVSSGELAAGAINGVSIGTEGFGDTGGQSGGVGDCRIDEHASGVFRASSADAGNSAGAEHTHQSGIDYGHGESVTVSHYSDHGSTNSVDYSSDLHSSSGSSSDSSHSHSHSH